MLKIYMSKKHGKPENDGLTIDAPIDYEKMISLFSDVDLNRQHVCFEGLCDELYDSYLELKAKLKVARVALEFYGDEKHMTRQIWESGCSGFGERAKKALAEIEK